MRQMRVEDVRPGTVLERDGARWRVLQVDLPEEPDGVAVIRCRVDGRMEVWHAPVQTPVPIWGPWSPAGFGLALGAPLVLMLCNALVEAIA